MKLFFLRKIISRDVETIIIAVRVQSTALEKRSETAYIKACKKYGALPCSSVLRNMEDMTEVNLCYYNLGTKGCKALIYPIAVSRLQIEEKVCK